MRRKAAKVREIEPDAKYESVLVARFVNNLMRNGKKSIVENAIYKAFDRICKKYDTTDPVAVFEDVISKLQISVEVKPRRVGGATYQVPSDVSPRRSVSLAIKWLVKSIGKMSKKNISQKVFDAMNEVLNGTGWAVKKKSDTFKMAESNKAFLNYRW